MEKLKLNGREYDLPASFKHDLKVDLGLALEAVVPGALPAAADRDYPQEITTTVPCKGLSFRTEPGSPPKVIATWAFQKPDGTTHRADYVVPEEIRQGLAAATLTGDAMVTGVYEATLPQVQAALNAAWGIA